MHRHTALAAAALSLAVVAGACSAEDLAETVTEQAIENEVGGDVDLDVDSDDGSISIETDEGSVTYGNNGDLPESFPASFDIAEGMTVAFAGESSDATSTAATAILEGDRPAAEVVAYYRDLALAEGFTLDREIETDLDVAANMSMGDTSLNIIGGNPGGGNASVSITFETPNG